jgi:hypothetical protein
MDVAIVVLIFDKIVLIDCCNLNTTDRANRAANKATWPGVCTDSVTVCSTYWGNKTSSGDMLKIVLRIASSAQGKKASTRQSQIASDTCQRISSKHSHLLKNQQEKKNLDPVSHPMIWLHESRDNPDSVGYRNSNTDEDTKVFGVCKKKNTHPILPSFLPSLKKSLRNSVFRITLDKRIYLDFFLQPNAND